MTKKQTELCTDDKINCPQFNQRNVQKFLDDLSAADAKEQQQILDEISKTGIIDFLYKYFTVDRNFVKAIDASPSFIINQVQSSLLSGIPAAASFLVKMPDMFIGGTTNAANSEKPKRRKTTITITIEPADKEATNGDSGLAGVVYWNLFGG